MKLRKSGAHASSHGSVEMVFVDRARSSQRPIVYRRFGIFFAVRFERFSDIIYDVRVRPNPPVCLKVEEILKSKYPRLNFKKKVCRHVPPYACELLEDFVFFNVLPTYSRVFCMLCSYIYIYMHLYRLWLLVQFLFFRWLILHMQCLDTSVFFDTGMVIFWFYEPKTRLSFVQFDKPVYKLTAHLKKVNIHMY